MLRTGRRFGKTRAGAEWIRQLAEDKAVSRIALAGATHRDVINVMLTGESGLLNISRPDFRPEFSPTYGLVTWPNGVEAEIFSSEKPDSPRGRSFGAIWCDEVAMWENATETMDNLKLAMSEIGISQPRMLITTTPKPSPIIRQLTDMCDVVVTGNTYENTDLPSDYVEDIRLKYEGTRTGRQEIYGDILDDLIGALWTKGNIRYGGDRSNCYRFVVSVDPAMTSHRDSDETGLIVAGSGHGGVGYVLEDCSGHYTPDEWARLAVSKAREYGAYKIVCEVNQGGDLVLNAIRTIDPTLRVEAVRATKGKMLRAEPVAALYEQQKVFHKHEFPVLEEQMLEWTYESRKGSDPRKKGGHRSPDRLDAMVYAITDLMLTTTYTVRYVPEYISSL